MRNKPIIRNYCVFCIYLNGSRTRTGCFQAFGALKFFFMAYSTPRNPRKKLQIINQQDNLCHVFSHTQWMIPFFFLKLQLLFSNSVLYSVFLCSLFLCLSQNQDYIYQRGKVLQNSKIAPVCMIFQNKY